jgi:tol-pal system protein YbgF
MKNGFVFLFSLFLTATFLSAETDQSKKIYELIYEDLQRLSQHVSELDKKIDLNSSNIKALTNILEEVLALNQRLQSEQASLKEDQKQVPPQIQIVLSRLDVLNRNLNTFAGELAEIKSIVMALPSFSAEGQTAENQAEQTPSEQKTANQETAQGGGTGTGAKGEEAVSETQINEQPAIKDMPRLSPQEVYNLAYSDYLKGNYQLAIDGFTLYLLQFSDSPVADDAAYWIGECQFSQEKFAEAIDQFNDLIINYPTGDKIPAAYLKKGISLLELERNEEALSVFKLLISKYPYEEETKIAQEKIKEIRLQNA